MKAPLAPADYFCLKHKKGLEERICALSAMSWAYTVLHYSGKTARAVSIHFTPGDRIIKDKNGNIADSGRFQKYLKGSHHPSTVRHGNSIDFVAAVSEQEYGDEANYWLNNPLWKIFSRANPVHHSQFEGRGIWCLYPDIEKLVFKIDFPAEMLNTLPRIRTFTEFLVLALQYRQAADHGLQRCGIQLLKHFAPQAVSMNPIFGYIQAPFFAMLDEFYLESKDWVVTKPWPSVYFSQLERNKIK